MTASEPQKEYIITEEQIRQLSCYIFDGFCSDQELKDARDLSYALKDRPYIPQQERERVKFSSEDLILLAHDEWKRREERKHIHDETPWIAGFLSGFCTSRKWARECVDKLRTRGGGEDNANV